MEELEVLSSHSLTDFSRSKEYIFQLFFLMENYQIPANSSGCRTA